MRVRIEDWNEDGRGRGWVGDRRALVVQAHPGEEVLVRVDRTTKGTVQGRVQRHFVRDPERVAHPCAHENSCTGCSFLALSEDQEAAFKRAIIQRLFGPWHAPTATEPILRRPGAGFGARCGGSQIFGRRGARVFLGSYVQGTHEIVDNEGCPVLAPALARAFDATAAHAAALRLKVAESEKGILGLRHVLGRLGRIDDRVVLAIASDDPEAESAVVLARELVARGAVAGAAALAAEPGNVLRRGTIIAQFGAETVAERLGAHRFEVDPLAFFQVNPTAAEQLFERAAELSGRGQRVFEGYAGRGALTAFLGERFAEVIAVERDPRAAAMLSARAAEEPGWRAVCAAVDEVLPQELASARFDAVVLDPPRAGLPPGVLTALASHPVPVLVVLACDPASLAAALPQLAAAGYRLDAVEGVDQFRRTAHVEVVARLIHAAAPRTDA